MKKNPFFSVIIPTFNRADKLGRALESVRIQTYRDFEVIVCDDGSMDHTSEVVDSFSRSMDVLYVRDENWGGPAKPRNNGIMLARGEWICFLDADDWWYPAKLERVIHKTIEADIIYHDCEAYDISGKRLLKIRGRHLKRPVLADLLTGWNALCNSSVCVRKSILYEIGGFSEERNLIAIEDFELWLRISQVTQRFCYVPESLGVYWVGSENISSFTEKSLQREARVHQMFSPYLPEASRLEAEKMLFYRKGLILWYIGDKVESRKMFIIALSAKRLRTKSLALIRILLLSIMIFLGFRQNNKS